jgi:hypothetical protein
MLCGPGRSVYQRWLYTIYRSLPGRYRYQNITLKLATFHAAPATTNDRHNAAHRGATEEPRGSTSARFREDVDLTAKESYRVFASGELAVAQSELDHGSGS